MNQTTTSTSISPESVQRIVLGAVNIAVASFGVVSNLAVVLVIGTRSQLRTNCKYMQAGLAAGDAITSLGVIFNHILNIVLNTIIPKPKLLRWQCVLIGTTNGMGGVYSTLMIVFIAFDRLVAIARPVRYKNLNKFKCFVVCAGFSASFSIAYTIAVYAKLTPYTDVPPVCVGTSARGAIFDTFDSIISLSCGAILVLLYPLIVINLHQKLRQHNKASNVQSRNPTGGQFSKQVEATISVLCVLFADILLHVLPNTVLLVLSYIDFSASVTSRTYVALGSCVHSSINCLLYVWKEPKMRAHLQQLFCWRCSSSISSTNSITPSTTDASRRIAVY